MSQPIQLTQEEIDRRLNKMTITPEILEDLFGDNATPITRGRALQAIVDGSARHAVTQAQVLLQHNSEKFMQDFSPIKDLATRMYRERMYNMFFEKHPTFKDFRQAVEDAAADVSSAELPADINEDTLLEKIAAAAEGRIKQFKPEFTRQVSGESATPAVAPASSAPTTVVPASSDAGGLQGGPSVGAAGGKPKGGASDIWDD